jgi:uridine kinase
LTADLVERITSCDGVVRVLVDGIGSRDVASALVDPLQGSGRQVVQVAANDFLRPAGERFEWGREDPQSFRERWLDASALRREVLDATAGGSVLPSLWDCARDRSTRSAPVPLSPRAVVLVDGVLLLGRGLPAELTVHIAMSPAALTRRGVPDWQLDAFTAYDDDVRPAEVCDVLIRAEDPMRPAVLFR